MNALLIHVIELGQHAHFSAAASRFQLAKHNAKQAGFTEAVPAADADAHAGLEVEVEPVDQLLAAQLKLDVDQVHHAVGQLARRRDDQLHLQILVRPLRVFDPVKLVHTELGLGRPRLWPTANPVQFPTQKPFPFQLQRLFVFHSGEFRLEIVRVVALVQVKPAGLQLNDMVANLVEKIPVMRRHQKRSTIFFQKLRHPLDRVGVEMVRRFVEDQQIRVGNDRPAECNAPFFSAGQGAHQPLGLRRVEVRHRGFDSRVDVPRVRCGDLLLQFRLPAGVRCERLVLREQLHRVCGSVTDRIHHRGFGRPIHVLRQISGHQAGAPRDFTRVRLG